jgi:hypothetical protein
VVKRNRALWLVLAASLAARPAHAHPESMPQLVNRYVALIALGDRLEYFVTLALRTVPAAELRKAMDGDGDRKLSAGELAAAKSGWRKRDVATISIDGEQVRLDGAQIDVNLGGDEAVGGGPVVVEIYGSRALAPGTHRIRLEPGWDPPRLGETELSIDPVNGWDLVASEQAGRAAGDVTRFKLQGPRKSVVEDRSATFVINSTSAPSRTARAADRARDRRAPRGRGGRARAAKAAPGGTGAGVVGFPRFARARLVELERVRDAVRLLAGRELGGLDGGGDAGAGGSSGELAGDVAARDAAAAGDVDAHHGGAGHLVLVKQSLTFACTPIIARTMSSLPSAGSAAVAGAALRATGSSSAGARPPPPPPEDFFVPMAALRSSSSLSCLPTFGFSGAAVVGGATATPDASPPALGGFGARGPLGVRVVGALATFSPPAGVSRGGSASVGDGGGVVGGAVATGGLAGAAGATGAATGGAAVTGARATVFLVVRNLYDMKPKPARTRTSRPITA